MKLWTRARDRAHRRPYRLRRRAADAVGATCALVLMFGGYAAWTDAQILDAYDPHAAAANAGPSWPERLAARHGCWTMADPAPEGTIPGRAVVRRPGEEAAHMAPASVGFGMWLGPDETPATGDETPGDLHAFCPARADR